jgi:peptidoglycan hydrolase CwlO-like protein
VIRFRAPALRRVIASAITALLAFGLAGPHATADTQQQLDQARAKLRALEKRISAAQSELAGLRSRSAAIVEHLNQVESALAVIEKESTTVKRQIKAAVKRLFQTQAQLDRRVRITYQTGGGLDIEFLLGSLSMSDFATRLEVVDRATQSDRALIRRIQQLESRLERRERQLELLQKRRLREREALNSERAVLANQLAQQQAIMGQLDQDQRQAQSLVGTLAAKRKREIARARRLARMAALAQSGAAPVGGPAIGGVLLTCPVDQPHSYTDDFGAPRYAGGFHTHQGNDVFAPMGTPIRAPFPGTASVASNGLGGLSVKVYGSQGYVYNAHLSALGNLGSVQTGTVIGYVGNSGDARGTSPHDHFEWHPGGGGAVDPFPYLNSVC